GDGLVVAAGLPAEEFLGFRVGDAAVVAEAAGDFAQGRVEGGGEPHHPIGQFARGYSASDGAEGASEYLRHLGHGKDAVGDGEEPLTVCGGVGHGAQVEVGDVAHVDDAEGDSWEAGGGAAEQAQDEVE